MGAHVTRIRLLSTLATALMAAERRRLQAAWRDCGKAKEAIQCP